MTGKYKFANGYGASVIDDGYGSKSAPYELAVIGKNGRLDYSTPITSDVLGWLTEADVKRVLAEIAKL